MDTPQIISMITKAGLNLIPAVGGGIASIVGDLQSVRKEKRMDEFLTGFAREMEPRMGSIIRSYVANEEFLDVFESILRDIMNQRTLDKRIFLCNLLITSITTEGTTYDRTEEFQRLLNELTVSHIRVLSVFYDCREIHMNDLSKDLEAIRNAIYSKTGITDEFQRREIINDLETRNIVNYYTHNKTNLLSGAPLYSNYPYITVKGQQFYEFLTLCGHSKMTTNDNK